MHGASPARVIVCSRLHPLKRLSHYSSIWSHQPFEFLLGEAHVIVCRVVVVVQVGVKDERVIRIQGVVCLVLPESAQGQECNVSQDEPCWLSVLHVQRKKRQPTWWRDAWWSRGHRHLLVYWKSDKPANRRTWVMRCGPAETRFYIRGNLYQMAEVSLHG